MTYLALLRGINVGGNNIIKMKDLKECFESMKFSDVRTYIQSGNAVFGATKATPEKLEKKIEAGLKKAFDYNGFVVVVSEKELEQIVKEAPKGFGIDAAKYRYDVIFLKRPMTAKKAGVDVPTKEGVDTMHIGKSALYFSRLTAKASSSRLHKITGLPVYKHLTIRNWNTTTKLLDMMQTD